MAYITTKKAPTPGNYSQASVVDVGAGFFVYTAGQTGNLPPTQNTDEPVVEGGIGPQTRQALMNLDAVLMEAGGSLENVIKTTVFLEDLEGDKKGFEEAYVGYFNELGITKLPARSTIEAKVPLAQEPTIVEIEAVAYIPK